MIPLKLQLKNFLSYGDDWTTVDFEPYHFICMSGKNGHGKSALLDAMTWALWGQARKVSGTPRADDALVHLGRQDMAVVLEFMCHEQRYIVRRELVLYQTGPKLTLDFGVFDPQEQRMRSLVGKTMRLTQESIQEVIGLDFDSFVSSVFLRQGQSNEFSKKTAQERKQILAAILGIDQYERMRKCALEKLRTLESERDGVKQLQAHLQNEYLHIHEVKRLFTDCEQACIAAQATQDALAQRAQVLAAQKAELARSKELIAGAQRELDTAKLALQEYTHRQELAQINCVQELEIALAAAQTAVQTGIEKKELCSKRVTELEHEQTVLDGRVGAAAQLLTEQPQYQNKFVAAQALFEKRKECYQRMSAYGNWVHNELKTLKNQQAGISSVGKAQCPLCRQSLAHDHEQTVKRELATRVHFYETRLTRVGAFVQKNKQVLLSEHANVTQMDQQLQQIAQAKIACNDLQQKKEQITRELASARNELAGLEITMLAAQQKNSSLSNQLTQLKIVVTNQLELDLCYVALKKTVNDTQVQLRDLLKDAGQDAAHERESVLAREERALAAELTQARSNQAALLEQKGRLTQELTHLESVRVAVAKQAATLQDFERECADYTAIADMLGKDGIQALLIESVIPELEEEANDILARLTDNQARIFIESLRDLKGGGTRETLDIKIADNVGIRPYELFSGGEAFRIDFALRIAISKLLARRAGASLQTLIVDEGFGSQDEDGLALIIDMLYKIQDYFAKVIIVSHLPFLKDHAPVQFIVEKLAGGSTVRVIEQG